MQLLVKGGGVLGGASSRSIPIELVLLLHLLSMSNCMYYTGGPVQEVGGGG
jgi:hypothetical protein